MRLCILFLIASLIFLPLVSSQTAIGDGKDLGDGGIIKPPLDWSINPFADRKTIITEDMSDFIASDVDVTKYPIIRLSDTFFWFETTNKAEYSLTTNTEKCGTTCEADGKVTLYTEGVLFDSAIFIDLKTGKETNIKDYKYQISTGKYEEQVVIRDGKKVTEVVELWQDYNYEKLSAGDYKWRILGTKEARQSVDFIPIRGGKEFSEWAIWSSNVSTTSSNYTHLQISTTAPYNSLVAYYPFDVDDGVSSFDLANNVVASYNGAVAITTGIYGNSTVYDGTDSYYIEDTTMPDLTFPLTFSAWVKVPASASNYRPIMSKGNVFVNNNNFDFGVRTDDAGDPRFYTYWRNGATNYGNEVPSSLADDDVWVMITSVINSSYDLKQYINGVNVANDTGNAVNGAGGYPFRIGSYSGTNSGSAGFLGQIDEVMVFNTTLTDQQITDIYNNQSSRFKSVGTSYLKQFNITAGSNRINLSLTNIQTNMGTNVSLRVGEWDVSKGYNLNMPNDNTNGLVSYWKMDEASWSGVNGEVIDSAGTNNGVSVGAITTSDAIINRAGEFLGGDYVDAGNTASLQITNSITLMAWIKTTNSSGNIINKFSDSPYKGYGMGVASGVLRAWFYGDTTGYVTGDTSINDGNWHYVVAIYNSTTSDAVIYVDGVEEGTLTDTPSITDSGNSLRIGNDQVGGAITGAFNGTIDEVQIYNRVLTPTEIQDIYIKGNHNGLVAYYPFDEASYDGTTGEVKDLTGRNNGTAVGGATTGSNGIYSRSAIFNGVNDYVNVSSDQSLRGMGTLTGLAWIKPSESGIHYAIFGSGSGGSDTDNNYLFLKWATDNKIAVSLAGDSWIQSTGSVNINEWNFVGFTYNGSRVTFFINGIESGYNDAHYTGNIRNLDYNLEIGKQGESTNYFNGSIDDVQIYNRSLSADEIKQLYLSGNAKWSFSNFSSRDGSFPISTSTTNILPDAKLETKKSLTSINNWSGELLNNAGFEDGDLNNWTYIGDASVGQANLYRGCRNGTYCVHWDGSSSSDNYAYQDVDVTGYATYIDNGQAYVNATGWLHSDELAYDEFYMQVRFYNASGEENTTARYDTGTLNGVDAWTNYGLINSLIPVGTRTVQVRFDTWETGYPGGSADDFSVKVSTPVSVESYNNFYTPYVNLYTYNYFLSTISGAVNLYGRVIDAVGSAIQNAILIGLNSTGDKRTFQLTNATGGFNWSESQSVINFTLVAYNPANITQGGIAVPYLNEADIQGVTLVLGNGTGGVVPQTVCWSKHGNVLSIPKGCEVN